MVDATTTPTVKMSPIFRGVTVGGAGGAIAPPPFGRIEGAAGSGGAPP